MDIISLQSTSVNIIKSIIDTTTITQLENTLSTVLNAIKPTITLQNLKKLMDAFMEIKNNFFNNPSTQLDENQLLAISMVLLTAGGRFEEFECSLKADIGFFVMVYSFTLDYFICKPQIGLILTKIMCREKSILEIGGSDLVFRIEEYFGESKFRDNLCKNVFENIVQINPEGYKRTQQIEILNSFYDSLLYIIEHLNIEEYSCQSLVTILFNNLSMNFWESFEFESEEFGKINLSDHYSKSNDKLELALEEIIGILIKCLTRVLRLNPIVRQKSQTILFSLIEKNCTEFNFKGFNLINEFNIMKLTLIYLDTTEKEDYKVNLQKVSQIQNFDQILQINSLSTNSEKRKMSLVFMEQFEIMFKDNIQKQLWKSCNGLFTTLDSYGKYLIGPQWDKTIDSLLKFLIENEEYENEPISLFWYFKILLLKGMNHDNVMIQKYAAEFIFKTNIKLPLFNSVLLDTLIPNLNNYKFYDDVGETVDIESNFYYTLKEFFGRICNDFKDELIKIIPDIIDRFMTHIRAFNAIPASWGIFQIIYESGIRNIELNGGFDQLKEIVQYFENFVKGYPPYRKKKFLKSIASLYGILDLNEDEDSFFLNFFANKNQREFLNFKQVQPVVDILHEIVFGENNPNSEEQFEKLSKFVTSLSQSMYSDLSTEQGFFLIHLRLNKIPKDGQELTKELTEFIQEIRNNITVHLEKLTQACRSPYKNVEKLKEHTISNSLNLFSFLNVNNHFIKLNDFILIEYLFEMYKLSDQVNYDYPEEIEELTYHTVQLLNQRKDIWVHIFEDKINFFQSEIQLIIKALVNHIITLDSTSEEGLIFNICCLLASLNSIFTVWVHLGLFEDLRIKTNITQQVQELYRLVIKMKRRKSKSLQIFKQYWLELTELLFNEHIHIEKEILVEKMNDASIITHVREYNYLTINILFREQILPILSQNEDQLSKFYKSFVKTLKTFKNQPMSQHLFKAFLMNSFINIPENCVPIVASTLIECIEIDNSAFMHRQAALLVTELFTIMDPKLIHLKELIVLLITKKENRPRDTSFIVEIEEFMRMASLGDELEKIEIATNAYSSFPRFMIMRLFEKMIKIILDIQNSESQMSTHQQQSINVLEELIEYCIMNTIPYFMTEIEKKFFRPFGKQHRHAIYTWQSLLVFSEYLKQQKLGVCSPKMEKLKKFFLENLFKMVTYSIQASTRHYVEMFYINSFLNDHSIDEEILKIFDLEMKIQPKLSLIWITGLRLMYQKVSPSCFEELSFKLCLGIGSNTSYVRSVTQYIVLYLSEKNILIREEYKSNTEWATKMQLINDMILTNEHTMILQQLMQDVVDKYTLLAADMSVNNILDTVFLGETLEMVHCHTGEEMKKIGNKLAAIYSDDSTPENFEESWTGELKEIFQKSQAKDILEENSNSDTDIFQRKIDSLLLFGEQEKEDKKNSEMCVVASLLTKLPNLANLTRTCEVLGIGELVIPDKKIMKNKQYTNVTVTAEKWIPIVECNEESLPLFLKMKRENGYTIVALEQTSKSTPLSTFKFPEKCVLLLGKEKEGVPYKLLQYVDYCVEIEQFGKIRSLNVHISAVLSIWEFVKQKYIQNEQIQEIKESSSE